MGTAEAVPTPATRLTIVKRGLRRKRTSILRFPVLLVALCLLFAPHAALAEDEWVVRESVGTVEETVARLRDAIERSGSTVLAEFDHEEAARRIDRDLEPTRVVLFAQPRLSTPLVETNPRAAIDMPQRILVWQEGGMTFAGFVSPQALASRYGFEPGRAELRTLEASLEALLDVAAAPPAQRSVTRR